MTARNRVRASDARTQRSARLYVGRGFDLDRPALRPEQSRIARAALEWSLEDAAKAAGVSRRTVLRFERHHRDVKPKLVEAIRRAFETAGVRFFEDGPAAGAVAPPPLRVPPPA